MITYVNLIYAIWHDIIDMTSQYDMILGHESDKFDAKLPAKQSVVALAHPKSCWRGIQNHWKIKRNRLHWRWDDERGLNYGGDLESVQWFGVDGGKNSFFPFVSLRTTDGCASIRRKEFAESRGQSLQEWRKHTNVPKAFFKLLIVRIIPARMNLLKAFFRLHCITFTSSFIKSY